MSNANGQGVAAATAVRVNSNGTTVAVPVFRYGDTPQSCFPTPIVLEAGPVYLSLYGTGLRGTVNRPEVIVTIAGVRAPVLYAGSQPQYIGLDQVNLLIPDTLRGRGTVDLSVSIGTSSSNAVSIAIQ